VISSRLATLHELDTVYGGADLYKLVEVIRIDTFNQKLANKWSVEKKDVGV
jgi:hypothetical protein